MVILLKKTINIFILILYLISSFFIIFLLQDVLTIKELIILIIFLTSLELVFIYLIKNRVLLTVTYPAIIIIIVLLLNFGVKSNNLFIFVSDVVSKNNVIDNYRLITIKGKYKSISDLESKKIGYTKDTVGFDNLEIEFEPICYESFALMLNDLQKNKIAGAIILDNQYSELDHNGFEIIYKLEFNEEIIPVSKSVTDNTALIYVSAIDNYETDTKTGKSDVNLLLCINSKTKQILIIYIPRDYYILLPSKKEKDRMMHASIYGINEAIDAIELLLENKIDYYIKIDFTLLGSIIDKIGGIDVNSEYNFISSGVEFKKGINHLNGTESLIFARERKGLLGGDRSNGFNQEKVIEETIKKLISDDKYFEMLTETKEMIKTNIPASEILKFIKNQIAYDYDWGIIKYSLDGKDTYEYTYTYKCCKLNVVEPDIITVNNAITNIEYLKNDGVFN